MNESPVNFTPPSFGLSSVTGTAAAEEETGGVMNVILPRLRFL